MSNLYQMWYNLQHNVDQNWSMQPIVIPWTWHAESQIKNKTNNLIILPSAAFRVQIQHNIVQNPNWVGENQSPIYKCDQGLELRTTVKQIQVVVGPGLAFGTTGLQV